MTEIEKEIAWINTEISRLRRLRNSGKLTDTEFAEATRKISNLRSQKAVLKKRTK